MNKTTFFTGIVLLLVELIGAFAYIIFSDLTVFIETVKIFFWIMLPVLGAVIALVPLGLIIAGLYQKENEYD